MKSFTKWVYEKSEYDNIKYCESSLARMLSKPSIPWVIMTAYRKLNANGSEKTKEENGVMYALYVLENKDKDISYQDCPESDKVDVVERSYFVPMPKEIDVDKFKEILLSLSDEYQQDAIIFSDGKDINLLFPNGGQASLGQKIGLNQIGQAYSQHILKQNVSFVFEGFMQYHGNMARAYTKGLILPSVDEAFKIIKARLVN